MGEKSFCQGPEYLHKDIHHPYMMSMFDSTKVTLWSLCFIDWHDFHAQLRLCLSADDALLSIKPQPSEVQKWSPGKQGREHMKRKGSNSIHHPANKIHGFAEPVIWIWRQAWLKTQKYNFYPLGPKCVFYTMNSRDAYEHYISFKVLAPCVYSSSSLLSYVGICQRARKRGNHSSGLTDVVQLGINSTLSPFSTIGAEKPHQFRLETVWAWVQTCDLFLVHSCPFLRDCWERRLHPLWLWLREHSGKMNH